jgi:hypothetical protein
MKKLYLCLALGLFLISNATAQSTDSLKFDDLVAPQSPGFQILGISPQSIYRPTSTKALGTYFLNNIDESAGLVKDVAIEFTPYWLKARPNLTFQEYFEIDNNKGESPFWDTIKKTFVISMATTDYEFEGDSLSYRAWGFGFRTMLVRGTPHVAKRIEMLARLRQSNFVSNIYTNVEELLDENEMTREELLIAVEAQFDQYINDPDLVVGINVEEITYTKKATLEYLKEALPSKQADFQEFILGMISKSVSPVIREIRDEDLNRTGLQVQLSGATSLLIPNNNVEGTEGGNYGVWITASHSVSKEGDLQILLLARYQGSFQNIGATNKDIGISLAQSSGNYDISVELIHRSTKEEYETRDFSGNPITAFNKDNALRFTANAQFKISDVANLSFNAGKDFESKITTKSNLIALIGVNFDLFRNSVLKF